MTKSEALHRAAEKYRSEKAGYCLVPEPDATEFITCHEKDFCGCDLSNAFVEGAWWHDTHDAMDCMNHEQEARLDERKKILGLLKSSEFRKLFKDEGHGLAVYWLEKELK